MTFTRTAVPDLKQGDIIRDSGVIAHIDGPGKTWPTRPMRDVHAFPGRILNDAELRDEDGKHLWPYTGLIKGDRWTVQGNDLAHVDRIAYTQGEHVRLPDGRIALVTDQSIIDLEPAPEGAIVVSPSGADLWDTEWFFPWDLLPVLPGQTRVKYTNAYSHMVGTVVYVEERPADRAAHLVPVTFDRREAPQWMPQKSLTVV